MSGTIGALAELRREIDEIDQSLHELLVRRAAVSEAIAATKAQNANPDETPQIFYPAREADVLRRLVARHTGRLPVPTLVQIWREIISASVRLQRPMSVGMVEPVDAKLAATARDHFGAVMSPRSFDSAVALFEAVASDADLIGVLPVPGSDTADDAWWLHLASGATEAPRVVARLPILEGGDEALVVGAFDPGQSSADVSLYVVEATADTIGDISTTGAQVLASDRFGPVPSRDVILIAVEGYSEDAGATADDLIAKLNDETANATYVGGYAVPIAG